MSVRILTGDCREMLRSLPSESVQCIVTSPPYYGLRCYGHENQIGLEPTPDEFVAALVSVFREARRVLRDDGTLWLNLGDSYAGSWGAQGRTGQMSDRSVVSARQIEVHPKKMTQTGTIRQQGLKPKDLIGIPWRVAFALQADGWYLRSDIIWHKPNPMPESITDRPTSAHEHIFLLAKSARYFYDADAVREIDSGRPSGNGFKRDHRVSYDGRGQDEQWEPGGGRNLRNVWSISSQPFKGAHFATFPPKLIEPCIKAGCPEGGTVLDPFGGAGTTGLVASRLNRNAILIELNPEYAALARERILDDAGMFGEVA